MASGEWFGVVAASDYICDVLEQTLMRIKDIAICFALVAVMANPVWMAAQSTQKFTAAKHNEYGIVYSLPVTYIKVIAEAECTISKAGPFYNYARKYLGNVDVVMADAVDWTLKSVDAYSFGVANPDESYLMQFKSGSSAYLVLSSNGLPLAINTEAVEDIIPVHESVATPPSRLDDNSFVSSLPVELLAAESTAKRAEMAAQMIYQIRESRTAYVMGDVDQMPDGAALKLILERLDEQEQDLIALFCGTRVRSTAIKEFEYLPEDETEGDVIFRLSSTEGIVDSDDLSGSPVRLSLTIEAEGELPVDDKGIEKKIPKGAVMYNIPGNAVVDISYEGKSLCRKRFDVAQFGIDFGLDPDIFTDKRRPAFVIFNPETGGIRELGTVSDTAVK